MKRTMKKIVILVVLLTATVLMSACSSPFITNTPRSAVEQLLICTVVERAIGNVDLASYKSKKAFPDYSFLTPQVDKDFVKGYFELHLAASGIIVVKDEASADIIIQPSCGVLATDIDKVLIGTPSLPVPIPEMGVSLVIPEIPIFMHLTRSGYGRFFFTVRDAKSLAPLETISGANAYAEYNNWVVLLVPFKSDNVKFRDENVVNNKYEISY